jgi:hypothetical protein
MSNDPSFPSYPDIPSDLPQAPVRPKPVDTSFMLWMVTAGLGVLGFIVSLAVGGDIARENAAKALRDQGKEATDSAIDAALTFGFVFAGVVAAVFFGLFLLFAFKMRAGRNWARIVLAVLGGLSLILNLVGLFGGGGGALTMILTVVQIALVGGAIYFMFVKESAAYFVTAKRA